MDYDPKAFLLFALNHFGIIVTHHDEKMVYLERDYLVEIENPQLFKLLHHNQVIAPFDDVEQLCDFIKKDMALNGES